MIDGQGTIPRVAYEQKVPDEVRKQLLKMPCRLSHQGNKLRRFAIATHQNHQKTL